MIKLYHLIWWKVTAEATWTSWRFIYAVCKALTNQFEYFSAEILAFSDRLRKLLYHHYFFHQSLLLEKHNFNFFNYSFLLLFLFCVISHYFRCINSVIPWIRENWKLCITLVLERCSFPQRCFGVNDLSAHVFSAGNLVGDDNGTVESCRCNGFPPPSFNCTSPSSLSWLTTLTYDGISEWVLTCPSLPPEKPARVSMV